MKDLESRLRASIDEVSWLYDDEPTPLVSICLMRGQHVDLAIDANAQHRTASLMKVPVMLAVYLAAQRANLRLDERLLLQNKFPSVGIGGSYFSVDPTEDADPDLYHLVGTSPTVEYLVERMIAISSNLATNALFERIGAPAVAEVIAMCGAADTSVVRSIEDMQALEEGHGNRTTALDMGRMLMTLVKPQIFDVASCKEMLGHLSKQQWNDELPALLPPEATVFHKTGWITNTLHDAAIIQPPAADPFVLVAMTSGIRDDHVARRLLQTIGDITYRTVTG